MLSEILVSRCCHGLTTERLALCSERKSVVLGPRSSIRRVTENAQLLEQRFHFRS